MKKGIFRRFGIVILALSMIMCLIPMTALAKEDLIAEPADEQVFELDDDVLVDPVDEEITELVDDEEEQQVVLSDEEPTELTEDVEIIIESADDTEEQEESVDEETTGDELAVDNESAEAADVEISESSDEEELVDSAEKPSEEDTLELCDETKIYTINYHTNYNGSPIDVINKDEVEVAASETSVDYIINSSIIQRYDEFIFEYVFCGWSTDKDAKPQGVQYRPSESITINGDMDLYAVWGEYGWGDTLHAKGADPVTYDGDYHEIRGITETDPGTSTETGEGYAEGFYYQPLWYAIDVWRYTDFRFIWAGGTDVGSYTTPCYGQVWAEIGILGFDNPFNPVDDTFTPIEPATLTITPASLSVTAEDQKVKYTGSAITPEGTIDGLVTPTGKDQETATLVMDSFTEVGAHDMTYSISWDGTAKEKNYKVTEENLGTLTIYYELDFDANGGEGAPDMMEVESETATLPSEVPTKEGTEFLGWATTADAKEAEYKAGEEITLSDNTTLYAVWATVEYTFTKGDKETWTKGSKDTLDFTVKRSVVDDLTFDSFEGVQVDGKDLKDAEYVATKGSVNISLNASYLETLNEGTHEIVCSFTDGSAKASFTINKAEETKKAETPKEAEKSPKTGDPNNALPYVLIIGGAFMMIVALVYVFRKKFN